MADGGIRTPNNFIFASETRAAAASGATASQAVVVSSLVDKCFLNFSTAILNDSKPATIMFDAGADTIESASNRCSRNVRLVASSIVSHHQSAQF